MIYVSLYTYLDNNMEQIVEKKACSYIFVSLKVLVLPGLEHFSKIKHLLLAGKEPILPSNIFVCYFTKIVLFELGYIYSVKLYHCVGFGFGFGVGFGLCINNIRMFVH